MWKLERRTRGHFGTLIEISVHTIRGTSGQTLYLLTQKVLERGLVDWNIILVAQPRFQGHDNGDPGNDVASHPSLFFRIRLFE